MLKSHVTVFKSCAGFELTRMEANCDAYECEGQQCLYQRTSRCDPRVTGRRQVDRDQNSQFNTVYWSNKNNIFNRLGIK